jgi:hypothetical protein
VQRGEDEMAGERARQGHVERFLAAELADHDDVGIGP